MRGMRVIGALTLALLSPALAGAATANFVYSGDHAATSAYVMATQLNGGTPPPFAMDFTCSGNFGCPVQTSTLFTNDIMMTSTSYLWADMVHGGVANHAPYHLTGASWTGYGIALEWANYDLAVAHDWTIVKPYCSGPMPGNRLPVLMVAVQRDGAGSSGVCIWEQGVEFSIPDPFKSSVSVYMSTTGLATPDPSTATAYMTGIMAMMRYHHPSWSWFDIKAALRQTASNWPTYTPCKTNCSANTGSELGFGDVNYDAAVALSDPSTLYLQPPEMQMDSHASWLRILVYPFASTRRDHEVVYIVNPAYSWPAPANGNEYTASEFSTYVAAASGTLFATITGSGSGQAAYYYPSVAGTTTFMAFTVDAAGNVSRAQSFMPVAVTLTAPSAACLAQ